MRGERLGFDEIDDRRAEILEGLDDLLGLLDSTRVADGCYRYGLTVDFLRQEGRGRRDPEEEDAGKLVRRPFAELAEERDQLRRFGHRVDDEAGHDGRAKLAHAVLVGSDDAEVAAAPP